jgi:hypothetical protein
MATDNAASLMAEMDQHIAKCRNVLACNYSEFSKYVDLLGRLFTGDDLRLFNDEELLVVRRMAQFQLGDLLLSACEIRRGE